LNDVNGVDTNMKSFSSADWQIVYFTLNWCVIVSQSA